MEPLTIKEKEDIKKYFEVGLEQLNYETFKKTQKKLRAKYHPDNFEKFEDETIQEMATERFQLIENLAAKIESYLKGNLTIPKTGETIFHDAALFAFDKMKIEVNTADTDLKYHLFGRRYRWLTFGEHFNIPKTKASIIIDQSYSGRQIGFRESIKMYLTFGEQDSVDDIIEWLYDKIVGRANSLIIEGNLVKIDLLEMKRYIRQKSFLKIETG